MPSFHCLPYSVINSAAFSNIQTNLGLFICTTVQPRLQTLTPRWWRPRCRRRGRSGWWPAGWRWGTAAAGRGWWRRARTAGTAVPSGRGRGWRLAGRRLAHSALRTATSATVSGGGTANTTNHCNVINKIPPCSYQAVQLHSIKIIFSTTYIL